MVCLQHLGGTVPAKVRCKNQQHRRICRVPCSHFSLEDYHKEKSSVLVHLWNSGAVNRPGTSCEPFSISNGFILWSFSGLLGVCLKSMARFGTSLTVPAEISQWDSLTVHDREVLSHPVDLACSIKIPGAGALGRS